MPAQVPQTKARKGVADAAFWCTGVLSLISSVGKSYLAVNPYTYQELVTAMKGQDNYLQCISNAENCADKRPGASLYDLHLQGVSALTVLARCKSNYADSQWDEGSAALFAEKIPTHLSFNADMLDRVCEKALEGGILSASLVGCMALSLFDENSNEIKYLLAFFSDQSRFTSTVLL